jgi:hypothetical protein
MCELVNPCSRLAGHGSEGRERGIGKAMCRDGNDEGDEQYDCVNDEGRGESEYREGDEGLR